MAVSVSPHKLSRNSKSSQISHLGQLFGPRATRRERVLADVIETLAWYARHYPCPPRNSHDLKILLRVSIVLARAGKL